MVQFDFVLILFGCDQSSFPLMNSAESGEFFNIFLKRVSLEPTTSCISNSGGYNSAIKTQVTERIFKLTPIHASVISHNPWIRRISRISFPFSENSNVIQTVLNALWKIDVVVVVAIQCLRCWERTSRLNHYPVWLTYNKYNYVETGS